MQMHKADVPYKCRQAAYTWLSACTLYTDPTSCSGLHARWHASGCTPCRVQGASIGAAPGGCLYQFAACMCTTSAITCHAPPASHLPATCQPHDTICHKATPQPCRHPAARAHTSTGGSRCHITEQCPHAGTTGTVYTTVAIPYRLGPRAHTHSSIPSMADGAKAGRHIYPAKAAIHQCLYPAITSHSCLIAQTKLQDACSH
jgi:hypothetical protein